jgi:hypothetical protein
VAQIEDVAAFIVAETKASGMQQIRILAAAGQLPMLGDVEIMPPVEYVWQHHVPETGYLLLYGVDAERIYFRSMRVMGG